MSDDAIVRESRELFPVTDHWTYLYNGSIHPCARPVADAMNAFLAEWSRGGETAFFGAYEKFMLLKERFAALIGAAPGNIVITESTTAAINLAAHILAPQPGQNVVVTDLAFMSNTYPFLASQAGRAEVRFVENRDGRIDLGDLAAAIDDRTACLHICAVTVGSGFRYDLPAVSDLARRRNVPLIVDGAQALGVIDVSVQTTPMDFLACTASKWLMGPAGVGYLYLADRHLTATPPTVGWLSAANVSDWDVRHCKLHHDAMRFQGGIPNLIGVVGALAGLDLLEQIGRPFIERRVRQLTRYLLDELSALGVCLWTPQDDAERAGIVFFRTPNAKKLHATLKDQRIYCGHFLDGIRLDPNFYNTHEELDRFLAVVRKHVQSN